MKQKNRLSVCITACYFGLYIIIALSLLIAQPFGHPPDESNRYLIPKYIYENNALPNGYDETIRIFGYGFSYGFQPILPYIIQGLAMKIVSIFSDSPGTLIYSARSVNFLFGLFMAFFVLLLSKKWFRQEHWQWAFAFLVTFLPESIFIHTYVNTDSCCMLSTAIILYALTCGIQDGFSIRSSVTLSVGIILCALSYYNAYGYILSSILIFTSYFIHKKDKKISFEGKNFFQKGTFIALLVLAGVGWWFIRSAILYDGDFLGLTARELCARLYASPEFHPDTSPTWMNRGFSVWDMLSRSDFIQVSLLSFIGVLGTMSITTSIWIYRFYKLIFFGGILLSIIVPFRAIVRFNSDFSAGFEDRFRGRKWFIRFFHANLVFCIILPLILSIHYSYVSDYQPQGRYLLPALVPFAFYCIRGLEKGTALAGIPAAARYTSGEKWSYVEIAAAGIMCVIIAVSLIVTIYGYVFPFYAAHPGG